MRQNASQAAIAARMRKALAKAGLSQAEAARQLGYKQSTFNRWLQGQRRPADGDIEAFAGLVGVPAGDIIHGTREFRDWVVAFGERVMSGQDPVTASDEVSDQPAALNEEERQKLSRQAAQIRRYVEAFAGAPWVALTPERRRQVLEDLARDEASHLED
jgi:transcriptional regulator with XRE-family HTH domain